MGPPLEDDGAVAPDDKAPVGNGNGSPLDMPKHPSGPMPVQTSGPQKALPQMEGPISTLMRAQRDFIRAQQKYIHDTNLPSMIAAQDDYIVVMDSILDKLGPSTMGEKAVAQEAYIEALTASLERLGLL